MNRKTTLYAISVVALLFLARSEALACSCPDLAEPLATKVQREKRDSHAIFTGKVLKMTENLKEGYVSVELEVFDLWKGKLPVKATVLTGLDDGNCRFNFVVGETYLVYTKNLSMYAAKSLSTHMCFRTALYSDAKPDITILGTPKKRLRK